MTNDPLDRRRYGLLLLALFVLGSAPQLLSRPSPDVSWLLYAAERVADGARPYVDVVEVNPPLILWLNLLPVTIGRALDLSPLLLYRLGILAAVVGSVFLSARTLGRLLGPEQERLRRYLVVLLLLGEIILVRADFGERDHLMLLLVMPYVFAVAARARRVPLPAAEMVIVGLLAGLGVALKPYFLPLPLALESYLAWKTRSTREWLRPEPLAILLVCAGYLAAVLAFAPGYLAMAREVGGLYADFLRGPIWLTALFGEGAALPLLSLLAVAALGRRAGTPELWQALAVAVATLLASALFQGKGWRYHFVPAMTIALVLLGVAVWDARRPLARMVERLYAAAAAAALYTIAILTTAACAIQLTRPNDARYDADPGYADLRGVIRRESPGGSVLVLSSNMASSFPLVPTSGVRWTSRFPSVWLLPALYMEQLRADAPLAFRPRAAMDRPEIYLNDAVAEDLARHRPDLLVVLRAGPDRRDMGIRRLDYIRYFERDPRISRMLAEYSWLTDVDEYRVYRRGGARLDAPAPATPAAVDAAVSAGWDGLRGIRLSPQVLAGALILLPLFALAYARERRAAR